MKAKVIYAFESCIHIGLTHPSGLLESKEVEGAIRREANRWCKSNGATLGSRVSGGWTLGVEESQTRMIFSISRV